MSTDDSISEDASSSVVLSHDHTSANGGKESEASRVSSEDTGSGLALPEEPATTKGSSSTPACTISHKIRSLCLGTEEEFSSGRSLPFINPSSLETLRALVHEIQSSETDPEIWKKCEGRWLHLFQLVEKQYQEQILAQQEQYQCQIQLIQDEIKALVQLQNHQGTAKTLDPGPAIPSEIQASSPASQPLGSTKVTVTTQESSEEGLLTVPSSGYCTLSTWESGTTKGSLEGKLEGLSPHKKQDGSGLLPVLIKKHGPNNESIRPVSFSDVPHKSSSPVPSLPADRQRLYSQPLTSWAQRQKQKQRKSKTAQIRSVQTERREECRSGGSPVEHIERLDDPRLTPVYSGSALLKRSDSLMSEASGLTYWKMDENELYHPLPDSFECGSFLLMPDTMSLSQPFEDEAKHSVSLREIYQNKQKGEPKGQEWDSLMNSDASSPQVLTLEPAAHTRQSDRTSGFTSPSHFSSPTSPMFHTSHATPRPCSEDEGSHTATMTVQPASSPAPRHQKLEASGSLDDPLVLSLLRQNLREKHARHIADLRAYYEAEISTLKEKLDLVNLPLDMERSNQILQERCERLERALTEASGRIRELENKNRHLERQLMEWPERYEAAGSTVQALQQRLEETKQSSKEKDSTMSKLKNRLRQLEESVQSACKELEEREVRIKNGNTMLQDLLLEYDSLRKEHEGAKDSLMSTEDKLSDANEQISELKRVICKLEAQVKQLEHENMARTRQALHNHLQPSGTGLFHHPDLLLPSKRQRDAENDTKNSDVTDRGGGGGAGRGCISSEREFPHDKPTRRDGPLTPVMKALIQMEDIKATEGRALAKPNYSSPRLENRRPTVGFVDSMGESVLGRGGAVLQAQRSLSPEGHRSSSLPPQAQRTAPPSTPTKRETLLQPLSAKSSPKRCPTENVSTAFGRPLHCQQLLHNRFDLHFSQSGLSSSPSPRRISRTRLQFTPAERPDVKSQNSSGSTQPTESSESETQEVPDPDLLTYSPEDDLTLSYHARVQSLAEAEKLFDELTQEKQQNNSFSMSSHAIEEFDYCLMDAKDYQITSVQIEAALSRIPGSGSRVTLQSRLDEASLEDRLEKVNRDLGSIRMTLKRFHVLRSSANV